MIMLDNSWLAIVIFLLLLCRCSSEMAMDEGVAPVFSGQTSSVLVGNEGGFTYGNASIQIIEPESGNVRSKVFQTANQRPLGDVLQDMQIIEGRLYAVLNNSGRIEVMDTTSFGRIGSITGLTSPRYILSISDRKCYVTDFLAKAIHIIDPIRLEKTGEIVVPGWTEELVAVGEEVWVACRSGDFVYIIDSETDQVMDSVQVAFGPGALGIDGSGDLWVYSTGDLSGTKDGGLYRINTATRQIEKSYPLPANGALFPRLAFDSNRDTVFFFQDGVRAMGVQDEGLPEERFLPEEGQNWYGLGFDPQRNELWLADAKDYQQEGTIFRFDRKGRLLSTYMGGVIPSSFSFLD